jgi:hypothetical protein
MASGQDAGKAIGGAAATTIGSVLGGILGQALIPVPGVGAAVGGIAGGIIGDKVGNFLTKPSVDQRSAAETQMQAANAQLEASRKQNERITGVPLGGAQAFVNDPGKLFRVMGALGLSDDKQARELLQASGNLKEVNARAATAADKLNTIISNFKRPSGKGGLGYTAEQIANQPEYRAAQIEYNRLATAAKEQATGVKKLFSEMPPAVTKQLTTVINKVDDKTLTAVLAAKLEKIDFKFTSIVPTGPNPATPAPTFATPSPTAWPFSWSPPSSNSEPRTTFARGGVFSRPTYFKFASGGAFRTGLMGEAGPEAVMPLRRGPGGKLGVIATGSGGDTININAPITINQQPGQNSEQLAALVAMELSNAINQARSSSMYV